MAEYHLLSISTTGMRLVHKEWLTVFASAGGERYAKSVLSICKVLKDRLDAVFLIGSKLDSWRDGILFSRNSGKSATRSKMGIRKARSRYSTTSLRTAAYERTSRC